jgi:hypothetical protein
MHNKNWFRVVTVIALTALCLLVGCQTTVPVSYTEPAHLDMSGVSKIALDSDNSQITSGISQKLTASGKYTLATEQELADWKQWNIDRQAQEVGAAELVGAYTGNAVRADSTYLGKELNVSAVVKEIGNSRGTYFVRLEGAGNDSVDIFFVESAISKLADVEKGQTISVIGECKGFNPPNMEDTAEILRILGAGRAVNIVNARFPVDGLKDYPFTLDAVITLKTNVSGGRESAALYDGPTYYKLKYTADMGYQVLRARDGSLIGEGKKQASAESSQTQDPSELPEPAPFVARAIDRAVNEFAGEIVPTQRSITITLAKEADNKEAKKAMGDAEKLAKAKNYPDAAAAYGSVYATYKNFAAGYNQAVLTEVASGVEAAIELMEALVAATGNAEAQAALKGMQDRNAANQSAAAQLAQ